MQIRRLPYVAFAVFLPALCAQVKMIEGPVVSRDCAVDKPPAMSRFQSTDPHLSVWLRADGLTAGDSIHLIYTDPAGGKHPDDPVTVHAAGRGSVCFAKLTRVLLQSGAGTWSVTAYLNDKPKPLHAPVKFMLEGPAIEPTMTEGPVLAAISAGSCPSSAPQAAASFATGDTITLWLKMEGLDTSDRVQVRFTGPNGTTQERVGFPSEGVVCVTDNARRLATSGGNGSWSLTARLLAETEPLFPAIPFTIRDSPSPAPAKQVARRVSTGGKLTASPVLFIGNCQNNAPAAVNRFLSTDASVTIWIPLDSYAAGDRVPLKLTDPNGKEHMVGGGAFNQAGTGAICANLKPALISASVFGSWSVTGFWNGQTAPLFPAIPFTFENVGGAAPAPVAARAAAPAGPRIVGTPVVSALAPGGCPDNPPAAVSSFAFSDPMISVWFMVQGLRAGDTVRFIATDPAGREHGASAPLPMKEDFSGPICWRQPPGDLGRFGYGVWSAAAYLNDQPAPLFPPLHFTLSAPDPNLVANLNFIQQTLNAVGPIEWAFIKAGQRGRPPAPTSSFEIGGAATEACTLRFHRVRSDGQSRTEDDFRFDFRGVSEANVAEERALDPSDPRSPGRNSAWEFSPPHYALRLSFSPDRPGAIQQSGKETPANSTVILFRDVETANNTAKAIVSATDMCGK